MAERVGFGGGCHWCTEAVFDVLLGVTQVEQGFIQSQNPHNTLSEAVIVHFEPSEIPLDVLIEIHLKTHSSTSEHQLRHKYRSAVYTFSKEQAAASRKILEKLQVHFHEPLITQVLPFVAFNPSDPRYQGYYKRQTGFCTSYINPKLKFLRSSYRRLVKSHTMS